MAINDELRAARLASGLSIRQLAEMTGVAKNAICNAEYGHCKTRLDILERLAEALHCELHLLPSDSEETDPETDPKTDPLFSEIG